MNNEKVSALLEMGKKLSEVNIQTDKNLFEMANLKEYRHSAILGYLLGRKEQGRMVHLESFCRRLLKDGMHKFELGDAYEVLCEEWVDCRSNGKRPIDVLVEAKDKTKDFALIIENKCRGAQDQDAQICDYWEGVKNLGHGEENMYVLYLPPLNSFAEPSESSIGEELKGRFSSEGDLAGHFMTYSYRDLIIPWLKEDVLPNIRYGSGVLADSLRCYIDMLQGLFALRADNRDVRLNTFQKFAEVAKCADAGALWSLASESLNAIDEVLNDKTPSILSEKDANALGELQSKLWEVRSILREKNPLLDPANLSYEVYWLLRKNPTQFASQFIKYKLESGLFFQKGRKQSAWDGLEYDGHWLECCFHVNEFVKYCNGDEECGTILTFGVGNVKEGDCSQMKEDYDWRYNYLPNSNWLTILTNNYKFKEAKDAIGGDMLWTVATVVAEEAKRFSDNVKANKFG